MKPYPSGPEPDEWPSLVPPGGRPPTAVGTATPEPPEKPSRNGYRDRAVVMRIWSGLLGALFVGGSVALLTLPGLAPVLRAALGITGIDVISRSVSGSGLSMRWKGIHSASPRRRPRNRGRAA